MRNGKKRAASLLLVLAMSAGVLAGCSNSSSGGGGGNSDDGGAKDSIVIATANETPSLSPTEHNAVAGSYMNLLTYNTLFKSDMEMNPVPDLVEDYQNVSESEWEFTIKTGVKFHDGSEMTVEDVKASLEWAKTFPEVSLYNSDIVSVDIVDDDTIKITTPGPDAMLLNNLCHHGNAIVPKALIDSGHDFNTEPIGTGPYKFVEWNRGDSVVFEAFEDYFGGAPAIKNMTWKVIPEGSSRTIALEAGEIDFIVEVEAMDADRLMENEELEVLSYNATNETWLMMNNERPQFQNQNVRHAINSAINKDDIVTVAFNGLAVPAISQCPYNFEGSTEENA
ncbi:MAG TPA: ABC transporter substrate-binding protein, partial [Firmicutes bacterium]|nr:ABC transporter substrate-binding protein [Bacillota bacterium]